MSKKRLHELVDEYWDIARAEGVEGRDHDTPEGDAQRVRSGIDEQIVAIEESAFARGAAAAAGMLADEIARLLPNYQSNAGTDQARRQMLGHFDKFGVTLHHASEAGNEAAPPTAS